ncbi:MAG: hypothetical protein EXR18_02420 [Flavobacteriaceae bacterium]|nr:hypothetical protein [Flavobacteriaceae bacterium]
MKHTSKFTFSIILILLSFLVNAQQKKTDSIPPKIERFGIRVGADLFKLTRSFYDKNYKGIEFVGDYRLTKNYYLAAELGNENKTTEDDRINSTAKGTYIKVGFDYNSYENWLDMRNMVFIGLRYGASTFSQQLNTYKLYNTSTYFPEAATIISGQKFNGLSAQWFEVVVGMKAEVLKNIYVSFSVRMNRTLSNTKPENFDNLYIPGFNRTYNGDFGVGFNYTVSYFLPLYKTKFSPKK